MGNTPRSSTNLAAGQIFGDVLRELRRAAGLTQAELAERANLSTRGLSDLERGINLSPRRETLLALADAFQLSDKERERLFAAARRRTPASVEPASSTPDVPAPGAEQAADIQVFLIADVRGYSTYTYEHRDEEAAQLTMRFAAIARDVVEAHSGRVVELRGDEVMAVFASARAALRAAVELQQQVTEASQATPEHALRCGIGLEAGEAIPVEDGYRGLALNLAARLCSRAGPGEVLAGETIIGLARRVAGLDFRERGLASLKGFATPVRVIQVLPAEAPDLIIERAPEGATPEQMDEPPPPIGNFLWARPEHPLVAREQEMRTLRATLDAVQAGSGRVIFLVGEPGVGKTRLAQEVTLAARDRGFFIVTGRCYAPQENVPYYPFLEALSRAYSAGPATVRAALPRQWPEVARLVPDRSIGVPVANEGPASGSAEDQQRLFWHVTGFLQALAAERPVALLLDDLHWMDGASLALLLHLARHARNSPILLLGTYRDIEVQPSHPLAKGAHDLSREHLIERIEVRRLPVEGTAALLAATLEEGEVAEAVAALIHGPTDGNAFFAQEALRALVERGDVTLVDGRWELREGVELVVPENVRATILERVARLSPVAQQALTLASVLGQTFSFDDLLAMEPLVAPALQNQPATAPSETELMREEALEAALEEAVGARLVREAGGESYAFSHALAQRALYGQVSAHRRRRLHRAAAEAIERLPESTRMRRVGEVAYHFMQAEELARALPYTLLAGAQAQAVYANEEGEQHYRTAARLAQEVGDRQSEGEAYAQLGALYWWNVGDYGLAMTALEQAAEAQRASGNGAAQAETAALLARSYVRCGESVSALGLLAPWMDAAHELHAEAEPPAVQAALFAALADIHFHMGAYRAQLAAAERAVDLWRLVGEERFLTDVLDLHGIALRLLGRWQDGLQALEECAALARRTGALFVSAHASYHIAYSYLQSGQWERATAAIDVSLDHGEQSGNFIFRGSARFFQALPAWYSGDWTVARRWFEQAATSLSQAPRIIVRIYGPLGQGMIYTATGDPEAGLRYLEEAIAIGEETGFAFGLNRAQREMAEVELIRRQFEQARARLEPIVHALGCGEYNDITPLLPLLAWAHIELGDHEQAAALLERAAPQAEAQHHYLALLDVLRVRGLLCVRQERWQEGQAALEQALARARGMPHPYAEAKLLYVYGQVEIARGDSAAARERFTAALAICARLGERLYAERIERDLAALGA